MVQAAGAEESAWFEVLRDALDRVGQEHGDDLFFESRRDLRVAIDDGGTVSTPSRSRGLAARSRGNRAFLSDPRPEDAGPLLRAARCGESPPQRPATGAHETPGTDGLEPEAVERLLRGLHGRLTAGSTGRSMRGAWVGSSQEVHVARVGAEPGMDRRRGARLRLELEVRHGGDPTGTTVVEATLELDRLHDASREDELVEALLQRAAERRRLEPIAPGAQRIVLGPGIGGILVHELVGHALEADLVGRGGSWLAELKESWSPKLTIIDDPRRCRIAWRIDDEGVPTRPTPLIRDGKLTGLLHDQRSAAHAGVRSNGHGRRATFRDPVLPRMGCTFVSAGSMRPHEVLHAARAGIYIRRMEAGRTDTQSGVALLRVTDADRFVDGRLEAALEPFLLRVDGHAVLDSLEWIADDLVFDPCIGSCHRAGQPLVTSVGAPTMCIGLADVLV